MQDICARLAAPAKVLGIRSQIVEVVVIAQTLLIKLLLWSAAGLTQQTPATIERKVYAIRRYNGSFCTQKQPEIAAFRALKAATRNKKTLRGVSPLQYTTLQKMTDSA